MTRVLKMVFDESTTGKKLTWTLADPGTSIKKSEVASAMNTVLMKEIPIISGETSTVNIADAYIYTTDKIELA